MGRKRELRPLSGGGRETGAEAPLDLGMRQNETSVHADTVAANRRGLAAVVVAAVACSCSWLRWQLGRAEKIGVKLEGITTCAWQETRQWGKLRGSQLHRGDGNLQGRANSSRVCCRL